MAFIGMSIFSALFFVWLRFFYVNHDEENKDGKNKDSSKEHIDIVYDNEKIKELEQEEMKKRINQMRLELVRKGLLKTDRRKLEDFTKKNKNKSKLEGNNIEKGLEESIIDTSSNDRTNSNINFNLVNETSSILNKKNKSGKKNKKRKLSI